MFNNFTDISLGLSSAFAFEAEGPEDAQPLIQEPGSIYMPGGDDEEDLPLAA